MKHSRILLGITTVMLAIAGVAAANTHRAPLTKNYYVTASGACAPIFTHCLKAVTTTPCLLPDGTQIYTKSNCTSPAYFDQN